MGIKVVKYHFRKNKGLEEEEEEGIQEGEAYNIFKNWVETR